MQLLIVGLGSMGKRRARLIKGMDSTITVCGVDSAPARRAEAEGLGIPAYESIGAAVAAQKFDAALVCTAPLSHAAIIGQLLDAGLPVFTELNLVADGYEQNMAKAKQKGLPLFLSSTMLYRRETQYIKQQVAEFCASTGRQVNYIYHIGQYLPDWHPWENYKDFFVGSARTGGVREIFGIDLPWLLDAFGPVTSLHAERDKISALDLPYADSVFVTLRHASGAKGMLAADVVSPKAVRQFECFGEGLHLFWEGNPKALYRFDAATGEKLPVDTYQSFEHDPRYSDNVVENAYVDELANFFGLLAGTEAPRYGFAKDLETLRLIDAIQGDSEGGAPAGTPAAQPCGGQIPGAAGTAKPSSAQAGGIPAVQNSGEASSCQ